MRPVVGQCADDAAVMRALGYRELAPEHTCCPENQGLEFYLGSAPGTK